MPTILFLIDKSGSMSYDPLGGTTKLELEQETIRRAVTGLPAGSTIGVIAFNDQSQWVVPLLTIQEATSEADRLTIVAAVDAITADGGSELPAAPTFAFDALRNESGDRHVILLSDGKSRFGDEATYRSQIGGAVADGITLSTIAFGDDADVATMQLLADLGNGRYHVVRTAEDVPTVTVREAQVAIGADGATPAASGAEDLTPDTVAPTKPAG
jgi:Mg-chelatase subunit ChlD